MLASFSAPDPAPASPPTDPSSTPSVPMMPRRPSRFRRPDRWWQYPLGVVGLLAGATILLSFGASLPFELFDILGGWWAWWPIIPAAAILAVPALIGYQLRRWYWPICCAAVPGIPMMIYFALDLTIGAVTGITSPLGGGGYDIPLVMSFLGGMGVAFCVAASIGTATGLALADRSPR